jgi:hypothetical protein
MEVSVWAEDETSEICFSEVEDEAGVRAESGRVAREPSSRLARRSLASSRH